MPVKRFFILIPFSIFVSIASWANEDELTFFNVGQGHCTLVRRVGYVPLLIDAGSKQNVQRVEDGKEAKKSKYKEKKGEKFIQDIVAKINEYWNNRTSPDGVLNVIVTHGDEDHVKYIPSIIHQLKQGGKQTDVRLLLGGVAGHYQGYRFDTPHSYYSQQYSGLFEGERLGFLNDSGCITHLYCPIGGRTGSEDDKNTWSIVTRVTINQNDRPISAILTGDAEEAVQAGMLQTLGQVRWQEIQSDILLYPHHGAKPLYPAWARVINPQAVVISAGNHRGYHHPTMEALTSLFSGMLPKQSFSLVGQMNNLNLNPTTVPAQSERLMNEVLSHRIVYHDSQNHLSENLRAILPTIQHRISTINPLVTYTSTPYTFSSEPWYITLRPGWQCAQLNFPIYTTYTSGTMVFKRKPLRTGPFDIEFKDCPTDIELMAQVIQGDLRGERKIGYRINGILDDEYGDYEDFLGLSQETIRKSFFSLQVFQKLRPNLLEDDAIKHAREIFFLSFVTIPHIETNGQKKELNDFREAHLIQFLDYFRKVTQHINLTEIQEKDFFNNVTDLLFGKAWSYKNFKTVKNFNDRIAIFNSFVSSPHYHDVLQRNDWLYLYCLLYKALPYHRPLLANNQLTTYVNRFKAIPFYNYSGTYPVGGLEDRIMQAQNIYSYCSGNSKWYEATIQDIPDLIQELRNLNINKDQTKVARDLMSWLPHSYTAPVHLTLRTIAPFIFQLDRLNKEKFKQIGKKITDALLRYPPAASHLKILEGALKNELQPSYILPF